MLPADPPPTPEKQAPRRSPPPLPRPAEQARLRKVFHSALQAAEGTAAERSAAGDALLECVTGDPGSLLFVEAFLRQLRENPPAATSWRQWWNGRPNLDAALQAEDWNFVWREGYAFLRRNPRDAFTVRYLALAAKAGEWEEVELRLLRFAEEIQPGDSLTAKLLADALARRGELEEALVWWEREPHTGFAEIYRGTPAPPLDPVLFPEPLPENAEFAARVAALDFAGAERGLHVQARNGDRRDAEEWLERLQWLRARHALTVAEELVGGSTTATTVDRLRVNLLRRELDVLVRRAKRSPQDIPLHLELARRHRRLGNLSAAVQTLEPFRADPRAALELGEVRQQLRQFEEALALYAACIEAGDDEVRQRALERGLRLADAMGRTAQAAAWRETFGPQ